jgi:translation initiation factor 2B subunit (eIF-2B alpha/beta/delta family)
VDAQLRRELAAVARDRRSGAAELALRGVTAVQEWTRRARNREELVEAGLALLEAQAAMAPLLRLANEVLLAADAAEPARALRRECARLRSTIERGPAKIAAQLARRRTRERRWRVVTYSYSSTVMKALLRARRRIQLVTCSESRPGNEGRRTAAELAAAGIEVSFGTDAFLLDVSRAKERVVLGADAILRGGFVAKLGARALVERALSGGSSVWVLADSSKFWPEGCTGPTTLRAGQGPANDLWKNPPAAIRVCNPYFTAVPFAPGVRLLTEHGWMTPAEVHRALDRIRVSPRIVLGGVG